VKNRREKSFATDAMLGMFWCGGVRCYTVGLEVALVATAGTMDNPKLAVRHMLLSEREAAELGDQVDYVAHALARLLEQPQSFPLHGIHWVPRCKGGTGPVIDSEPQAADWEAQSKADLQVLIARFAWRAP